MGDNTIEVFFTLVRAGLWSDGNQEIRIDGTTDWNKVYQLAQEQSVQGLVLAGLEHSDVKPPKELLLQWIGEVQIIEQRNKAMNQFIADLIAKMREAGIYTLLVKGQGIAQCYERPYWRVCGDVDLFLSEDNYQKGKELLLPLSNRNELERMYSKELGLRIESWDVELHGSQRTGLSSRIDDVIDDAQRDVFYGGNVRSWMNGNTHVFLPGIDSDVFFVFTHFLKHFYKGEGACLRQICDWCRLLWTNREVIKIKILETRLKKASLLPEWRTFAAIAVFYLGMPENAMPLFSKEKVWKKKAEKILFIINGESQGRLKTLIAISRVFPLKAATLFPGILFDINWLKIKEKIIPLGILE